MSVVLVIDDEPTIRRLLSAVLLDCGSEAVAVGDAETAMTVIEDTKPDAIITDIRLPGMDGVEFARRIRDDSRFADVPLAFISAWEEEPDLAHNGHRTSYFRKPFDVEALRDWVTSVVGD
jgi:CheY-like chemotaxis protein